MKVPEQACASEFGLIASWQFSVRLGSHAQSRNAQRAAVRSVQMRGTVSELKVVVDEKVSGPGS